MKNAVISKIINILNFQEGKEEETQASFYTIDLWGSCYLATNQAYKKKFYSLSIYFVIDSYLYEWVPFVDAKKSLEWAINKHKSNRSYFIKKYQEFFDVSAEIGKIFEDVRDRGLRNYVNEELKRLYFEIVNLGLRQYGYAILVEGMDTMSEADYLKLLPDTTREKALDIVRLLSMPLELIIIEKEKLSLFKLAIKVLENNTLKKIVASNSLTRIKQYPDFYSKLIQHVRDFFWIQNSFLNAIYLDNRYFLNSLSGLIKKEGKRKFLEGEIRKIINKERIIAKQIKEIYSKYSISLDAKSFFELVRLFATFQDKRKENVQKMVFCIDRIFNEIEKRYKVQKQDLNYYLVSELAALLQSGKKVSGRDLKRRRKAVLFSYFEGGKIKTNYLFGKQAEVVFEFFKKKREQMAKKGKLKGFVASVGSGKQAIINGKVRIVFDPLKDIFKLGEILVTGMTRPEFVPLMKKAKAIITNEGGITTHAAILSRELKVPCLIGTKVATGVLRSGDYIQLDLNSGTVQVLKRNKS